jgi:hypothetical protein
MRKLYKKMKQWLFVIFYVKITGYVKSVSDLLTNNN